MQLDNGVEVLLVEDSERSRDQTLSTELQEQERSKNSDKQGSKKSSEWLPPGVSDEDAEEYDCMCACAVVLRGLGSFQDPPELQVWHLAQTKYNYATAPPNTPTPCG